MIPYRDRLDAPRDLPDEPDLCEDEDSDRLYDERWQALHDRDQEEALERQVRVWQEQG